MTAPDVINHEDDPDEGARDLSDIAISLLDKDGDGRISLDDFIASVQADPLLLEILGPCLPTPSRAAAVLAALGSNNAKKVHLSTRLSNDTWNQLGGKAIKDWLECQMLKLSNKKVEPLNTQKSYR